MKVKGNIVWIQHPQFNEENTLHRLDILDTDVGYGNLGIFLQTIHRRTAVQEQKGAEKKQNSESFCLQSRNTHGRSLR